MAHLKKNLSPKEMCRSHTESSITTKFTYVVQIGHPWPLFQLIFVLFKQTIQEGGSPGLVVMGGDSCSEGRGFESQHHKLDGHVLTYICCKNFNVYLKRR